MSADNLDLDIDEIIRELLHKDVLKYHGKQSKNSRKKYSDL